MKGFFRYGTVLMSKSSFPYSERISVFGFLDFLNTFGDTGAGFLLLVVSFEKYYTLRGIRGERKK